MPLLRGFEHPTAKVGVVAGSNAEFADRARAHRPAGGSGRQGPGGLLRGRGPIPGPRAPALGSALLWKRNAVMQTEHWEDEHAPAV